MASEGDGMGRKIILHAVPTFVLYFQMERLPNVGSLGRRQWDRSKKGFGFAGSGFLEFHWDI
jgi:hypothetical protein